MTEPAIPTEADEVPSASESVDALHNGGDARDGAVSGRARRDGRRWGQAVCSLATAPLILASFLGAVGFCHAEYDPSRVGFWAEFVEDLRFRTYRLHDIELQLVFGTIAQVAALSGHVRVCRSAWRGNDDGRFLLVVAALVSYGYSLYVACFERAAVLLDLKILHFATGSAICVITLVLAAINDAGEFQLPDERPGAAGKLERRRARQAVALVLGLAALTWAVRFVVEFEGDWFLFDFALQPALAVACAGCPWPHGRPSSEGAGASFNRHVADRRCLGVPRSHTSSERTRPCRSDVGIFRVAGRDMANLGFCTTADAPSLCARDCLMRRHDSVHAWSAVGTAFACASAHDHDWRKRAPRTFGHRRALRRRRRAARQADTQATRHGVRAA